jgi:hypothetical protein
VSSINDKIRSVAKPLPGAYLTIERNSRRGAFNRLFTAILGGVRNDFDIR